MRKIFLITLMFYLFLTSCAPIQQLSKRSDTSHVVGNRWIDVNNVMQLAQYSSENNLVALDVMNILGEPIYIEKYNINNSSNTLLWYLFKTKYYPIVEVSSELNRDFNISTIEKQIKPEMSGDYDLWSDTEKWFLVIVNDGYNEMMFINADELDRKPKFNRQILLETKKIDKNLIRDLDPESAKALLENN